MAIVNYVNFNQTGSCIAVGSSDGSVKIFNCDPYGKFYSSQPKLNHGTGTSHNNNNNNNFMIGEGGGGLNAHRDSLSGSPLSLHHPHGSKGPEGYGIVEMLFNTSLLAVVGLGEEIALSPRKLRLLNTKRESCICEITFPSSILSIKMNKSRLVVLLQAQIYIYDITNMKLLHTIETTPNQNGLIDVSNNTDTWNYLVYSSSQKVITSEIKNNTPSFLSSSSTASNNSNSTTNSNSNPNSNRKTASTSAGPDKNTNISEAGSTGIITTNGTSSTIHKDIFTTSPDTRIVSVSSSPASSASSSLNTIQNQKNKQHASQGTSSSMSFSSSPSSFSASELSKHNNSDSNNNDGSNDSINTNVTNGTVSANTTIKKNGDVIIFNLKTLQPIMVIEAHKGEIAALKLSHDGKMLATASDRGTIIRVFSTETGNKEYQFRRGTYKTKIHSLEFNSSGKFLACTSSSRTVHIFKLNLSSSSTLKTTTQSGKLKKKSSVSSLASKESSKLKGLKKQDTISADGTKATDGDDDVLMRGKLDQGDISTQELEVHRLGLDDEEEDDDEEDEVEGDDDGEDEEEEKAFEEEEEEEEEEGERGGEYKPPVVDSARSTVARMIRKSSQKLQRQAAKALGEYFPQIRVASILEPSRHFASLKVPAFDSIQSQNLAATTNHSNNNNNNNNNSDVLIFENLESTTSAQSSFTQRSTGTDLNTITGHNLNNGYMNPTNLRLKASFGDTLMDIDIKDYPEMLKQHKNSGSAAQSSLSPSSSPSGYTQSITQPGSKLSSTLDNNDSPPNSAGMSSSSFLSSPSPVAVQPKQQQQQQVPSVSGTDKKNIVQVLPIFVVSTEGYLHKYFLDPERGGDCILISQYSLLHE